MSSRNRGIYQIGDETIARLLRLPEGQRVIGVSSSWERMALLIQVEGVDLPEVFEGCDPPVVNSSPGAFPPASLGHALPPTRRHAVILYDLGDVLLHDPDALAGRRRILERHAPKDSAVYLAGCSHCTEGICDDAAEWPCPDYRDASAGLPSGFEAAA